MGIKMKQNGLLKMELDIIIVGYFFSVAYHIFSTVKVLFLSNGINFGLLNNLTLVFA